MSSFFSLLAYLLPPSILFPVQYYKCQRRNKAEGLLAELLQENDCEHLLAEHQLTFNGTFYKTSVNHATMFETY